MKKKKKLDHHHRYLLQRQSIMENMALGETICETRCQPLINYCCVDYLPIHSVKISISGFI